MRRNRWGINVLVTCLVVGGAVAFFVLPVVPVAITAPDQSTGAPLSALPAPPNPNTYEPEVLELIKTTYLGRGKEFPDPEEPAIVLQKYLEQNAHGYHAQLAKQGQKLNAELAEWQALTRQYPQSRHAFVALGKYYRTKAQASGDIAYTRQAADAYIQAAEIGLAHGHIRYTRELSELLVELGDRKGLDEIFGRLLAQPTDLNRTT